MSTFSELRRRLQLEETAPGAALEPSSLVLIDELFQQVITEYLHPFLDAYQRRVLVWESAFEEVFRALDTPTADQRTPKLTQ